MGRTVLTAEAFAVQLHFASLSGAETSETDSGGSHPPERWSPLKARRLFDELPTVLQKAWVAYAQRVAPF